MESSDVGGEGPDGLSLLLLVAAVQVAFVTLAVSTRDVEGSLRRSIDLRVVRGSMDLLPASRTVTATAQAATRPSKHQLLLCKRTDSLLLQLGSISRLPAIQGGYEAGDASAPGATLRSLAGRSELSGAAEIRGPA